MFLFGRKKGNKSPKEETSTTSSAKVVLTKAENGLERHLVRLKKDENIDLSTHRARVFVVIDRSYSMKELYLDVSVQEVLTRLLPLALKFDDNGELEVYVFNSTCTKMSSMNLNNYENYVEREIILNGFFPTGGTSYSPVIKQTISDYNDESQYPAFGIFITDGNNSDADETDRAIRDSSKFKIFYQFVGIGPEKFEYLQKLDDLEGRDVDNTAFIKVSDFARLDDEQLYEKLLEQYPQWLKAMKIN